MWKDLRRIFHAYPQKEALGQKIDRGVERIKQFFPHLCFSIKKYSLHLHYKKKLNHYKKEKFLHIEKEKLDSDYFLISQASSSLQNIVKIKS